MTVYYVQTTYSFDDDINTEGPFQTEEQAWKKILLDCCKAEAHEVLEMKERSYTVYADPETHRASFTTHGIDCMGASYSDEMFFSILEKEEDCPVPQGQDATEATGNDTKAYRVFVNCDGAILVDANSDEAACEIVRHMSCEEIIAEIGEDCFSVDYAEESED